MENELDKATFIVSVTQLLSDHGQEQSYFIELNNKVMSMLENYHMNNVHNMTNSYNGYLIGGNAESFDQFELEYIANSRLLIESKLSKALCA